MTRLALPLVFLLLLCGARSPGAAPGRQTLSFDPDWRFLKADAPGAERPAFADGSWRTVAVPHDWALEGSFDPNAPEGGAGAFLPTGVGWYRKHFSLPAGDAGRRVFVDFDGVMANSDVWINGALLGHRPYGYVSFRYELTGHLQFGPGRENVLAVRADNSSQPASRWYAGAGIYRHVRLVVTAPIHLGHWATVVTTPQVLVQRALVRVRASVVNQSAAPRPVSAQVTLLGPDGQAVGTAQTAPQTVPAGAARDFPLEIPVASPRLWNVEQPNVYRAVTRVRVGSTVLDEESVPLGIREFHFDPDTGFWLNGKNFKIKGVCLHGEVGALGVAVPLSAWRRRLAALKSLGVNAIRTAHAPPAPEFLDLCDQMGFLVMDEMFDAWTVAKNPYDYHLYFRDWSQIDTRDTVQRDRNHPSIILYSAGNEIHDTPNALLANGILKSLLAVFHQNDPTRPVTQALFRPNASHDYENGLADLLDVVGQNYREPEILAAHAQKPTRRIIGTENGHAPAAWRALRDNPPYAGQFLWTGVDYLGESRRWPVVGSASGLLDRTDTPRARAFQRQSWWSDAPLVRIARVQAARDVVPGGAAALRVPGQFLDWTPRAAGPHTENVEVYSNCASVELTLNGKSLGAQARPADDSPRRWRVAYEPGTLRAVGTDGGRAVAADELHTAGAPARIVLDSDRDALADDWDDVGYVRATVVDASGVRVPDAADLISFKASGPGVVAAVDNGDVAGHEPFQASQRHAYEGVAFAIIRATAASGTISLTASAPGLTGSSVSLRAVAPVCLGR